MSLKIRKRSGAGFGLSRGVGYATTVVVLLLLTVQPAAALETARMELPDDFAASALRLPVSGIGGRNRGHYTLGDYSGAYTRIESRWAIFDPLMAGSRGKSSYTIDGPGVTSLVAAECGMRKNTVTVGVVNFDPKKLTYQCSFTRGGQPWNANFVLGQSKRDSVKKKMLARSDRNGVAAFDGVGITFRSSHAYAGTRIQAPTPVGYFLEYGDRLVAAVELTDVNPTVFLATDLTDDVRLAALYSAMALSVLRDPENSALGD